MKGFCAPLIGLFFLSPVPHPLLAGQSPVPGHPAGSTLAAALPLRVSPIQSMVVGRRIWKNECDGTIAGLTSWNRGESFPSLGIGHFIWYPQGVAERFQESFPALIDYFRERGITVPAWLIETRFCPWPTKAAFEKARQSLRMRELRRLLASTISIQAEFIARRLAAALPLMTAALSESERNLVTTRFSLLCQTPEGLYALMDYTNFKGEGISSTERYAGQGWGLLQVLQGMKGLPGGAEAVNAFAASACRVLERRVAHAPSDRRALENRFLPGWKKRVHTYPSPVPR